jgi:hypothetical protein
VKREEKTLERKRKRTGKKMCDERPNVCAAELKGPPTLLLHLLYKNKEKGNQTSLFSLLVIVIGSMRLHRA